MESLTILVRKGKKIKIKIENKQKFYVVSISIQNEK